VSYLFILFVLGTKKPSHSREFWIPSTYCTWSSIRIKVSTYKPYFPRNFCNFFAHSCEILKCLLYTHWLSIAQRNGKILNRNISTAPVSPPTGRRPEFICIYCKTIKKRKSTKSPAIFEWNFTTGAENLWF